MTAEPSYRPSLRRYVVGVSTPAIPEPTNVGPVAGGHLRASDADREQVATVLSTAYAEGRITRDEHDERLDKALNARTFDELIPITSDLVMTAAATAQPTAGTAPLVDTAGAVDEPDRLIAIFGGCTRKGKWRVRKNMQSMAVFGGIDLDMREAVFEAPVVEINGFWCFGGLDIKVPAGIEVRDQTMGVFGGTDVSRLGDRVPGAPILVIKGMTLFGGVSVSGPKVKRGAR